MSKNKSELIKKIAKVGIGAGLCLSPILSNGQSLKEDINWRKQKEPYGKYTLSINSQYALPELSRYQTYRRQPYLPNGNLNLNYKFNYTVPQDSIKGDVSKYLKKIDVCPECTKPKRITSTQRRRTTPTPKLTPTKKPTPVQEIITPVVPQDTLKKQIEKEQPTIPTSIYNVDEKNITNNYTITNNNYYGDTTRNKIDTLKKSGLEFRLLLEGYKTLNITENPLDNPFWGVSGTVQIGKGSIWVGPYATVGFGSEKNSTATSVYKKILLNQAIQLFAETQGTETQNTELGYPVGFGGTLSLNSKDNRVRFDLSYGLVNKVNSTSDVTESGFDRKMQGNNTIEEKPYNFTLEKGMTYKDLVETQKIGLAFEPLKKVNAYVGVEAQHIGKLNSDNLKKENVYINAKLGWRFGGGKR